MVALGLIGYPLEHSLSPRIHAAALERLGLPGEYRLFLVPPIPEGSKTLKDLISRIRSGELDGLNVTIPHKQSVIPLLDDLAPSARAIGAVNTVLLEQGRTFGDNTDAPGFLADLQRLLDKGLGSSIAQHPFALVLGAGGSARAVVYALLQAGWRVVIAARRLEQAQELVAGFQPFAPGVGRKGIRLNPASLMACQELWSADMPLIVNTTPLGMSPRIDASPWPAEVPFPKNALVYDLIYNPGETALVRAAREAGLAATTGLGMLIEQAALSFERWTGQIAPREAMRQAATSLDRETP